MSAQICKPLIDAETSCSEKSPMKITVVGGGQVGLAAAYSCMLQGVCTELALVDVVVDKLQGEKMDLEQCQQFIGGCKVKADTDYKVSANSKIIVVTAGARQREGESRLNLVQRNVDIFKGMIPKLAEHSPDAILVIVANPVDIMTMVAWKLSGFPRNRVVGTGTMLDSARFRFLLGKKLNVNASSCHGYIIGEHGDSSVAVWNSVNIAGVTLKSLNPDIGTDKDPENYGKVHKEVIDSAYEIIRLKGYTSWAIGATIAQLCKDIVIDKRSVHPLCVFAKGMQGIEHDVYLSLPCVVGHQGATSVVPQNLTPEETQKLHKSAETLNEVIAGITW